MSDTGDRIIVSCTGKERYGSAKLAHAIVRRRHRAGKVGRLAVYRCRFCGAWHHEAKKKFEAKPA